MKCGVRVALGVAGGYFLGRTKKMKLAMMLGGMAAGRNAGSRADLLSSATKLLGSSPELSRLTEEVRGRLLEAGKGAAVAVATRQVESLTDRVGKRVESLGDVGARRPKKSEGEPETDEHVEDEAEPDDIAEDAGPAAEDEEAETGEPEAAPPRRPREKASSAGGGGSPTSTATLKRPAAGKAAAGRKSGRPTRTQRSEGND